MSFTFLSFNRDLLGKSITNFWLIIRPSLQVMKKFLKEFFSIFVNLLSKQIETFQVFHN